MWCYYKTVACHYEKLVWAKLFVFEFYLELIHLPFYVHFINVNTTK